MWIMVKYIIYIMLSWRNWHTHGDGNIGVTEHPESRHPQLRVKLYSASPLFLKWIKERIYNVIKINTGWIEIKSNISVLVYGKADSIKYDILS